MPILMGSQMNGIEGHTPSERGNNSSEQKRKTKKKKWKRAAKIASGVATGLALSQVRGSNVEANAVKLAKQKNSRENYPPVREQYHRDLLGGSKGGQDFVIDQNGGSGLDEDGFPEEGVEETVESQNPTWEEAMDIIGGELGPDYSRTDLTITGPGYFTVPDEWEIFSCNTSAEEIAEGNGLSHDVDDNGMVWIYGGDEWLERRNGGNFLSIPLEIYEKIEEPQEGIKCTFFSYTPKPEN